MPVLSGPGAMSDYFSSLKDTADVAASVPSFDLADAPYSPTNAATIPTATIKSPYADLKQWSLDSQGEYEKVQAVSGQQAQQMGLYLLLAAAVLLMVTKR